MSLIPNVERWRSLVGVIIAQESREDRVGPSNSVLVDTTLAIIQKESSGDPRAVGDNGNSLGLMQLNYGAGTPQSVGFTGPREQLFDPSTNVTYGVRYLLRQIKRYNGDLEKAILAYNAGSYRLTQAGLPINQEYLDAVLSFLSEKKKPLQSSPSSAPLSWSPVGTVDAAPASPERPHTVPGDPSLNASDTWHTRAARAAAVILLLSCLALSLWALRCI